MNCIYATIQRVGFAGAVGGSLLAGVLLVPERASAQVGAVNPCPTIYYEEPFNSNVVTPDYCPPNAFTRFLQDGTTPMSNVDPLPPQDIPLPSATSDPVAYVQPADGMIDIQIDNATNVGVYYQVTGETDRRMVLPEEGRYLRNIPLPATVTAVRADDGLLRVIPATSQDDTLELTFEENPNFDDVQGVIRIQSDGQIFIY